MATIIDELLITLGIDGTAAKKSVNDITATLKGGLSSVTKIFSGFGAALMGAFSVGSAFSTWKDQVAELGGVSKRLHMSMEDLQGWTGAVGKFGGSASDFENSLRGLNAQLAKMAVIGKSRTGTFLQSLGIDPGELGRQRDALQVLEELAGVMEQMTPDEARSAGQALGLDSSMIMLLQQGRDGMKELIRQKKEDAIYTQEDADAVKAYNVEMGKIKKGFIGIMGVLFRTVLPGFTMVSKGVGQFVNYIRKHQTAVKAFFVMIAALVTGLLLPSIIAFFSALLSNPITWVILALAALAAVIEDLIVWLEGGDSALEDFWVSLFGSREDAKQLFKDIEESVKTFVDEAIPKLKQFKDDFLQVLSDIKRFADENPELINNLLKVTTFPLKVAVNGLELLYLVLKKVHETITQDIIPAWERFKKMLAENIFEPLENGLERVAAAVEKIGITLPKIQTPGKFVTPLDIKWDTVLDGAKQAGDAIDEIKAKVQDGGIWGTITSTMGEIFNGPTEAVREGFGSLLDSGAEILGQLKEVASTTWEEIKTGFDEAIKLCIDAWKNFFNAGQSALNGLLGPVSNLAGSIRSNIIGAIQDAAQAWQAFQTEMANNPIVIPSAGDYGGGGAGGGGNTEWNITMNGVQNGQQAAADFRHGIGSRFNPAYSNSGVR